MIRLTDKQMDTKIAYIEEYTSNGLNGADSSNMDANANSSHKSLANLNHEINKDITVSINHEILKRKINEMFGSELANEYKRQIDMHEIYLHDASNLSSYCASITMYPFLINGTKCIGDVSSAPKNLTSFCGNYINLIYAVSGQLSGAVATVEYLLYFDHFARGDYGDDYLKTNEKDIKQQLQGVIYSVNSLSGARGMQSPFTNITIYDKHYFESMFSNFIFPDGTKPDYKSLAKLQEFYLDYFLEISKKELLSFPVITTACLNDGKELIDKDFEEVMTSNIAKGGSFFTYTSSSADSLSSCCRLRNELTDKTFSNSSGAGGVSTGSLNVITLNINRMIQDNRDVKEETLKLCKYQHAYREIVNQRIENGMIPIFTAGFIRKDKQFSTIGVIGVVEGAESLGIKVVDSEEYEEYIKNTLGIIDSTISEYSKENGFLLNQELPPGESLASKFSMWDSLDGYATHRKTYSSYLFPIEDNSLTILDKMKLHGDRYTQYCSGGSALPLNLENHPTKEQAKKIFKTMVSEGVPYMCINVRKSKCRDCGEMSIDTISECGSCGSDNIVYGTRIVGYLRWEDDFAQERRAEAKIRAYHK